MRTTFLQEIEDSGELALGIAQKLILSAGSNPLHENTGVLCIPFFGVTNGRV
jgi:hypothetical protein